MSPAIEPDGSATSLCHRADRRKHPLKYLHLKLSVQAWALWIPVLARDKNLKSLLARAAPGRGTPYAGLSAVTIARCCRRVVRHSILMSDRECLREGLLLNRFLIMAGFAPTLHFGVDRASLNGPRAKAHCWIKLGEQVFSPPSADIVEILTHHGSESFAASAPGNRVSDSGLGR